MGLNRQRDLRVADFQNCSVRVSSGLALKTDDLLISCENKTPDTLAIVTTLFDSVALLGHINSKQSF